MVRTIISLYCLDCFFFSSLCSIIILNFMLDSFQKQMVTFEITVSQQAKLHYRIPCFSMFTSVVVVWFWLVFLCLHSLNAFVVLFTSWIRWASDACHNKFAGFNCVHVTCCGNHSGYFRDRSSHFCLLLRKCVWGK